MLKIGDKVIMNDKYRVPEKNRGKVFTVRSEPKEVGGTLCVLLEGFVGCYAADGLEKVDGEAGDKEEWFEAISKKAAWEAFEKAQKKMKHREGESTNIIDAAMQELFS